MPSDLLFEVPQSLSPRLAWMQRHGILTRRNPILQDGEAPFEAWVGDLEQAINRQMEHNYDWNGPYYAAADSVDDAILQLAISNGWPLWNEEARP